MEAMAAELPRKAVEPVVGEQSSKSVKARYRQAATQTSARE